MNNKFFRFFVLNIIFILAACAGQQPERVNPTPKESITAKPSISLPPFDPSLFVYPSEPPPVKLSEFEFELEVNLRANIPRVYIVEGNKNGEIKTPPAKYKLKGGQYGIVMFDLASGCQDGKIITLDKDTILNYDVSDFCG